MDEETPDIADRRKPQRHLGERLNRYREWAVAGGALLSLAGVAGYDIRLALIVAGLCVVAGGLVGLMRGKQTC